MLLYAFLFLSFSPRYFLSRSHSVHARLAPAWGCWEAPWARPIPPLTGDCAPLSVLRKEFERAAKILRAQTSPLQALFEEFSNSGD
mmetsp:Transcript_21553/g.54280  ORF Transcript_21553/g.54280 Transcript_21553/m.54280 type:complete len:86 (-) Transcript_21553:660-917(-)